VRLFPAGVFAPVRPREDYRAVESDPTTLDYITGIGQVVAVVIAAGAAYYAARAARSAERSALGQTRPLLLDVPLEPYAEETYVAELDGDTHRVEFRGEILSDRERGWMSVPLRNAGQGLAKVERAAILHEDFIEDGVHGSSGWTRSNVPAGEETRIELWIPERSADHAVLKSAITTGEITLSVTYTDLFGKNRETATFYLAERPDAAFWTVWRVMHEPGGRRSPAEQPLLVEVRYVVTWPWRVVRARWLRRQLRRDDDAV
jgi:hypothetical protein